MDEINLEEGATLTAQGITPTKLTDWANEPSLLELKNDLEKAKPSHDAYVQKLDEWDNLLNVTGSEKPKKIKGRSAIQPKLIRKQAEWRYAALSEPFLGSDKLFKIEPVTFEDVEVARQNELLLNWQMRTKLDLVSFIDEYVRANVDEGGSILRLGWLRRTKTVEQEVPVFDFYPVTEQYQLEELDGATQLYLENRRAFEETVSEELKEAVSYYRETGVPVVAVISEYQTIETEEVLENKPTIKILNPRNVIVDPSCNGVVDDALFIINTFETNHIELKEAGVYKNLDKVIWDDDAPMKQSDYYTSTPSDFQFSNKNKKKVVAHEYWGYHDINGDGIMVPFVATWIGNVMIRLEESPYPDDKLPFVFSRYLPKKREVGGEPDAELLADNQRTLGAVTRGMIDSLGRSANSQTGIAKGVLDPLNKRRFLDGELYEFNPTANPQSAIREHTFPELPQSAYNMLLLQNQEAESLTGVKSFSGGISGEAYGDVAAGIRGALDAASKREMAILRRLAKGIKEVGTKIAAMNSVFLSEEEVVRVTNDEFVVVRRKDLKGNFDITVDISTAEVDNAKSNDLAFMLQTMGPDMDPQMSYMILSEIAELKRMPRLAHSLRNYRPEPSPEEQMLQQLQIEEARLKVAKLQAEIDALQGKALKDMAHAEQLGVDTEEQVLGIQHARQMEQQRAQSQGNQNLQITKALTTPTKPGELPPSIDAAIGYNALSQSPISTLERDTNAYTDPTLNLGSSKFDPSLDPALNPNINI